MTRVNWPTGKRFAPVCWSCGEMATREPAYRCDRCGGTLDILYDYEALFARTSFEKMALSRGETGIWRYRSLMPLNPGTEAVTLGEGNTPILKIRNIQNSLASQWPNYMHILPETLEMYLKMESQNPTLAFKDRPLAVAINAARQFGIQRVVCASTGNTGVSAAAYAARAGLPCTTYVPAHTPREKLEAMRQYGAELVAVEGSFSDAYAKAAEAAAQGDAFNLTSTYLNPYAAEGDKTVAYELAEQLEGRVPDWIIVPIGAGPLLSGIFKGYREMLAAGYIDRLPRMAGVQAEGCAPIAEAFMAGEEEVRAWSGPSLSAASGIADPLTLYPEDGTRTLSVIRESGGAALSLSDEALFHWRGLLARREGLLAELSSATGVAAAAELANKGIIRSDDTVVAIVTGHGFKDMSVAINQSI